MQATKNSPTWQAIVAANENWFSDSTKAFWASRVYWDTLTEVDGGHLFITREVDFTGDRLLFSVRLAETGGSIHTLDFQAWETLPAAKAALTAHASKTGVAK